jgi:hypothetical protein
MEPTTARSRPWWARVRIPAWRWRSCEMWRSGRRFPRGFLRSGRHCDPRRLLEELRALAMAGSSTRLQRRSSVPRTGRQRAPRGWRAGQPRALLPTAEHGLHRCQRVEVSSRRLPSCGPPSRPLQMQRRPPPSYSWPDPGSVFFESELRCFIWRHSMLHELIEMFHSVLFVVV